MCCSCMGFYIMLFIAPGCNPRLTIYYNRPNMLCLNQGIAQTLDRPNMLSLNQGIAQTLDRPNMLCLNQGIAQNPRPTKHVVSKPTNCHNPKPTKRVVPKPTICPNPKSTKFNAMLNFALAFSTIWTDVLMPTDFAYCYFPFWVFDICILDIIV
jgi:hypothetical protein